VARLELLVELGGRFPVVLVELLLGGLVELLGRPVLVLVLLEEAAARERGREDQGGQCRYTSRHDESWFEERELYPGARSGPGAAPHDPRRDGGLEARPGPGPPAARRVAHPPRPVDRGGPRDRRRRAVRLAPQGEERGGGGRDARRAARRCRVPSRGHRARRGARGRRPRGGRQAGGPG